MIILAVVSIVCIVIGVLATLFFLTLSDGSGNETGMIAGMLIMFGALPFLLLGLFLSIIHTLASVFL